MGREVNEEIRRADHDDANASSRKAWATAVARMFGGTDAKRRYDDLGFLSIGTTDSWLDRDVSISVSGSSHLSLTIMLDGEFISTLDGGNPLPIKAGSAVLFSSEQTVSGTNTLRAGQRLRLIDIRYGKALLESAGGLALSRFARELLIDRSIPEQGAMFLSFPGTNEMLSVATQISDCNFEDGAARNLYLQGKALESLALVIAFLNRSAGEAHNLTSQDQQRLEQARALLDTRYGERWTIASLSRSIGVSERKLKEGFRATIGSSVHSYLTEIRLTAAAAMLREGRSVTDVALSVGFDNLSHFSKVFRQFHGVNPSAYRGSRGPRPPTA